METLARSVRRARTNGQPIQLSGFPSLTLAKIAFRSSEVSVIAAKPGMGKTALALALAARAEAEVLYCCGDTSEWTIGIRVAANATGMTQDQCEEEMLNDPFWYARTVHGVDHVAWSFEPEMSAAQIDNVFLAYQTMRGYMPELTFIDNLMNVDATGGSDSFVNMKFILQDMVKTARKHRMHIAVLHHVNDGATYDWCPPRDKIQGKPCEPVALGLSLHSEVSLLQDGTSAGIMFLAPVKNRNGITDMSGNSFVELLWDPTTMRVIDKGHGLQREKPKG